MYVYYYSVLGVGAMGALYAARRQAPAPSITSVRTARDALSFVSSLACVNTDELVDAVAARVHAHDLGPECLQAWKAIYDSVDDPSGPEGFAITVLYSTLKFCLTEAAPE